MQAQTVAAAFAAVLIIAGCETSGSGTATSPSGDLAAVLTWEAHDSHSGTMNANLSSGGRYSGPFFQITEETRADVVSPLWDGWSYSPRHRWDYWGPGEWTRFVTYYSGRVVANLSATDGTHMRCRFHLANPSAGFSGGGQGDCQLPDGRSIDAVFPPG